MSDLRSFICLVGVLGCLFLVCLILGDIINIIKKRELETTKFIKWFIDAELKQQLITIGVGFCIIVTIAANTKLGSTNIGGLFERINYTESYYVNLFRENAESKNYKVEAEIEKTGGEYYIVKAYFPNSGHITFYNSLYGDPLEVNKPIYLIDDNNKGWRVELTTQKSNKKTVLK